MTNAEKFKEVFGFDICFVSSYWWNSEYQGTPTIPLSVIEKITTEIEERTTYEGIYLDRADVLDIIDKAVKECTHEQTSGN